MTPYSVPVKSEDYLLSSYHFDLPEELIAQTPSPARGGSRLFVLDRADPALDALENFSAIASLLPPKSLLVANNSKVIPARIFGQRDGGGALELLLLTPPPLLQAAAQKTASGWFESMAEGLIRPAKKLKTERFYPLGEGLGMAVLEKLDFGKAKVLLRWQGSLTERIWQNGRLPLPPYIKREPADTDFERYQTIYADDAKAGSLAAPTAGLHFTPEIRQSLARAGHDWAELTLFVGYGTFSPVRVADIRQHDMHAEYAELTETTARKILAAKAEGRPVVAVGTTSARVLEAVAATQVAMGEASMLPPRVETLADAQPTASGQISPPPLLAPHDGWLNCFIYPGKPIRVVDGLITNFHLPESTLLMLAAALTGRERILGAYRRAVENRFRFFSYGDAMLIK